MLQRRVNCLLRGHECALPPQAHNECDGTDYDHHDQCGNQPTQVALEKNRWPFGGPSRLGLHDWALAVLIQMTNAWSVAARRGG